MKTVGIDIGSYSIKVVEVAGSKNGIQIVDFYEHVLGQNPAHDAQLEIVEFLRGLAEKYDPAKTKIICGLRQERVSVRTKLFPFADKIKILKSLPFELEEEVPFATEDAIFDNKIIRTRGKLTETLAVATPKQRVREVLSLFKDTGLELSILSPEALAFANCSENWSSAPLTDANFRIEEAPTKELKHVQVQLILGHTKTIVCVFENQKIIDIRTILWGGKLISEAIAAKYEIPLVEAIKELNNKGFVLPSKDSASYDQIVFSDVIMSVLKELGKELQITLIEIKADLNAVVEKIEVTGGVANIKNISAVLTQMTDHPVNRLETLRLFSNLPFEVSKISESKIGIALGLAIEGFKKPRNPAVNFLRQEFAKQVNAAMVFWKNWGSTLQLAGAAFVVFYLFAAFRESSTEALIQKADVALKAQGKSVAQLSGKQNNEAGVKKYIKEKKKQILDAKVLSRFLQMNSAIEIVKKITESSPSREQIQMSVKNLKIQGDIVFIEGIVGKLTDVATLQQALAGAASDGKVAVSQATIKAPQNMFAFSFSFKVDRGVSQGMVKSL